MKTLACCYLTHNHPDVIDDILTKCLDNYSNYGFDILVFDDSDDESTHQIITKFISQGYSNLYYIDAHGVENGDDKYIRVLQGWNFPKHYDYILPTKDRSCYGIKTLEKIRNAMESDYDVILPASEESRHSMLIPKTQNEYTNAVDFFKLYGFYTTNWECLIRKTSSMLSPIDWDKYKSTYNLGINNNFNQTLSLFIRLAELDYYKIKVINKDDYDRYICQLVGPLWRKSIFDIWIDKWVSAIFSLPSIYDPYKLEVIKSETALNELFGSVTSFITLKEEGIFNESILNRHLKIWSLITDIPLNYLQLVVTGNYNDLFKLVSSDFEQALFNKDYDYAYFLFHTNSWIRSGLPEETYEILSTCFNVYRNERNTYGYSSLFHNISSSHELVERYKSIIDV